MLLRWIELRDFRSYAELWFAPDPGINILVGENGAGKTNLLEAVAYLSRLRSVRGVPEAALVRTGADSCVVRGEFERADRVVRIETELIEKRRRRVLVDGKRPARRSDVPALAPVVVFLPDDLELVKRGPSHRREFLDDLAALLWPAALGEQQEYGQALRQRNAGLRQGGLGADETALDVWDQRLVSAGSRLVARRTEVLEGVAPVLSRVLEEIGMVTDRVGWEYRAHAVGEFVKRVVADDVAPRLRQAVGASRRVDRERRTTMIGPHRDEVTFLLEGRDARSWASQGEQRSLAVALRLGAYELLKDLHKEVPPLLLDDVFSELDPRRAQGLVARMPDGQVLITTSRERDVPVSGRRWQVEAGSVR